MIGGKLSGYTMMVRLGCCALLFFTLSGTVFAGALHDAARRGDINGVKRLAAQGADIDGLDPYGFSPLLLAKLNDRPQTARFLESQGARARLDELVERIQLYLRLLGYQPGAIDGFLGPATRTAISRFQARERFAVTGRVYEDWVVRLHRKIWLKLQRALKDQGHDPGALDGLLGPALQGAIRSYQQQAGLPVTGAVSQDWAQPLLAGAAKRDAAPVQAAEPAAVADSVAGALPVTAAESEGEPQDSAAQIRHVQARLRELGFYAGDIDGQFDPAFEDGVRAFQRQAGLAPTGRLSDDWIDALDQAVLRNLRTRLRAMGYEDRIFLDLETDMTDAAVLLDFSQSGAATAPETHGAPAQAPEDQASVLLSDIRSRLQALGFQPGAGDAEPNSATAEAIKSFQRQASLPETGQITAALRRQLDEEIVRAVQAHLQRLSLYQGPVDGLSGPRTEAAIKRFQERQRQPQTGQASAALLAALRQALAEYETEQQQREAQARSVENAQSKLDALGFDPGGVDGRLGSDTEKAIRAFQQQAKLPVDGRVSEALQESLDKAIVSAAQNRLRGLGYQPGNADGELGPKTQEAIRAFQARHKLAPTGRATPALLGKLQEISAAQQAAREAEAKAQAAKANVELVRAVQRELKARDYAIARVDGELGRETHAAILAFQRDAGLPVNGQVSGELLASIKAAPGTQQPQPQHAPDPPPVSEPVSESAGKTVKTEADADVVFIDERSKPLGSREVAEIQSRLNSLGYAAGPADGRAGRRTRSAIRAFQQRIGLQANGQPSRILLAKLQSTPRQQALAPSSPGRKTARGNTEISGKLRLQRADNGTLIGCSIKGTQLDLAWCKPFKDRRDTDDCKAIIRPNSKVLMVKCS